MSKIIEKWLLFKYVDGEFTPLSKPTETKAQFENARMKYPERERKTIGIGLRSATLRAVVQSKTEPAA